MQQCTPSTIHEILRISRKLPIVITLYTRSGPFGPRFTWQGIHIGLVGNNLLLGRYSSVRAVDELVAAAWIVVVGGLFR